MTDGEALLAAIRAEPDDDTPRLVYADWLQEQGKERRANFIRGMCDPKIVRRRYNWSDYHTERQGLVTLKARDAKAWGLWPFRDDLLGSCRYRVSDCSFVLSERGSRGGAAVVSLHNPDRLRAVVRRGFVECVLIDAHSWFRGADQLAALCPVLKYVSLHGPVSVSDLRDEYLKMDDTSGRSKVDAVVRGAPVLPLFKELWSRYEFSASHFQLV